MTLSAEQQIVLQKLQRIIERILAASSTWTVDELASAIFDVQGEFGLLSDSPFSG